MFMFRKKDKIETTIEPLKNYSQKFQAAVKEVRNMDRTSIDGNLLQSVAGTYGIKVDELKSTFIDYLKINAKNKINETKKTNPDATIYNFEVIAEEFLLTLKDLDLA